MADEKKNQAARKLGAMGASRGGRARASVLTPEERSSAARKAARARWGRSDPKAIDDLAPPADLPEEASEVASDGGAEPLPHSMFHGEVQLGEAKLAGYVLNDGRRVFPQLEIVAVLSGGTRHGNLSRYLERNPLTEALVENRPIIRFKIPKGPLANGYEATFLIDLCLSFVKAHEQGLLHPSQAIIAARANAIVRASAKVGIEALVDEATGYQEFRKKQELQMKFKAFIAEDMQEWAKAFPDEFWFELARLEGVRYSPRSRPLRWGKYVMAFVYDAIDKDVGHKLREINPKPRHGKNHHQWLANFGRERLTQQLWQVIGIMKACKTMDDFRAQFAYIFKHAPLQLSFLD